MQSGKSSLQMDSYPFSSNKKALAKARARKKYKNIHRYIVPQTRRNVNDHLRKIPSDSGQADGHLAAGTAVPRIPKRHLTARDVYRYFPRRDIDFFYRRLFENV